MREEILPITGMTCGGCVKSVSTVLSALSGVENVEVSLEDARAKITYDETRVGHQTLVQAVIDAGFGVADQQA